jgi:hypothetical protein
MSSSSSPSFLAYIAQAQDRHSPQAGQRREGGRPPGDITEYFLTLVLDASLAHAAAASLK